MANQWLIEEHGFDQARIELNGSRYMTANGYMGYRGTLEEHTKEQLVACNMAGLFDKDGDQWRESVNAPNGLYTVVRCGDVALDPLVTAPVEHEQILDICHGLHRRRTAFSIDGAQVEIAAERFVSMADFHAAALRYSVTADQNVTVTVYTGIDDDVWSINGKHFSAVGKEDVGAVRCARYVTGEKNEPIVCLETVKTTADVPFAITETGRSCTVTLEPGTPFVFEKVAGVYWGEAAAGAMTDFSACASKGYDALRERHCAAWDSIWENADVCIEGDEEAQFALRYSIYQLVSIVPRNSDRCGIPARGLSGQVYKGASFWDTEMFMLPFFSFTDDALAKNLVKFRINTIEGAKRKAAEYGYEGAFYPWESQETGDDACTLFNVTDIFTGRPMRTYFRDRQIHVSADVAYGIWEYYRISQDASVLIDGGLETIYQCLRFFYTYSHFKMNKDRFEFLNVVGPDEYHERVDNNAFTNHMVQYTAQVFEQARDVVKSVDPAAYEAFAAGKDLSWVPDFVQKLYVPQPNEQGIIEQFDGYFDLEDVPLSALRERVIEPNEYWGGGNGLATTTRVIKQADVVMMQNVFRADYPVDVKRANWDFYEPYTEHGSSLSACAYAIVAAEIGYTDWAYKYFMKTASVDLTGNTRQYLGSLYIGGTHPAANGGAWNTAIFGLAGVSYTDDVLNIAPRLPVAWKKMSFKLMWKGTRFAVSIEGKTVTVTPLGAVGDAKISVDGVLQEF